MYREIERLGSKFLFFFLLDLEVVPFFIFVFFGWTGRHALCFVDLNLFARWIVFIVSGILGRYVNHRFV